jgi:hypothetical protein
MKHLQHIDQCVATLWVLMVILLIASIAAGYLFWLRIAP